MSSDALKLNEQTVWRAASEVFLKSIFRVGGVIPSHRLAWACVRGAGLLALFPPALLLGQFNPPPFKYAVYATGTGCGAINMSGGAPGGYAVKHRRRTPRPTDGGAYGGQLT